MIGMLKRNLLEVMLLEESFTRFRAARADGASAPGRVEQAACVPAWTDHRERTNLR